LALGHYSQAQKDARLLLSQGVHGNQNPEYIFKARCLLAQAKLAQGDARWQPRRKLRQYSSDPQSFTKGEDVTYLLMTRAQILLALGQFGCRLRIIFAWLFGANRTIKKYWCRLL
jgi:hypothetical protein